MSKDNNTTLNVVELSGEVKKPVESLHEALMSVLADYAENNLVTRSELLGALVFVGADIMKVYDNGD